MKHFLLYEKNATGSGGHDRSLEKLSFSILLSYCVFWSYVSNMFQHKEEK